MIPSKKCVVDTNVPKVANLAVIQSSDSDVCEACIQACINAIDYVRTKGELVIDAGGEIFSEYLRNLSIDGQPGMGNVFMKWVNDKCWGWNDSQRVWITKNGNSYEEFPEHEGLHDFDISDRKFVAVANAHSSKPPILQATDSKWWGCKDSLDEVGITVQFLCPHYVQQKYAKKIKK